MILKGLSQRRGWIILGSIVAALIRINARHSSPTAIYIPIPYSYVEQPESPRASASNSSLGFEKIVVLSRKPSWRTRGLQAAADLTGLEISIPSQPFISPHVAEAFEKIGTGETVIPAKHGSTLAWLAHLDLLKHIIMSGLTTTLILEDDVDWDVRIKQQMQLVADNTRKLLNIPDDDIDPYGTDWDVLWIGHCGEVAQQSNDSFIRYGDDSRVSTEGYNGWSERHFMDAIPEGHRQIQFAVMPVCTFGFAVTAAGAQNILRKLGSGMDEAYDVALQHKCASEKLRCLVVQPEVMHHYESPHSLGYVSEIGQESGEGKSAGDEVLEASIGTTANMIYSARCKALFDAECLAPGTPPNLFGN
ncbi:hypothetical protein FKW77_002426 [Venturia effusa]|uniref:Glycosyltransferase family 25 protein n=1 Tax=Venturia effusa TaxID=50376 RepID=A0A517L2W4_9PEZI|nr:hypothetical protein FKW77_002426 [Venturia effusa]